MILLYLFLRQPVFLIKTPILETLFARLSISLFLCIFVVFPYTLVPQYPTFKLLGLL